VDLERLRAFFDDVRVGLLGRDRASISISVEMGGNHPAPSFVVASEGA